MVKIEGKKTKFVSGFRWVLKWAPLKSAGCKPGTVKLPSQKKKKKAFVTFLILKKVEGGKGKGSKFTFWGKNKGGKKRGRGGVSFTVWFKKKKKKKGIKAGKGKERAGGKGGRGQVDYRNPRKILRNGYSILEGLLEDRESKRKRKKRKREVNGKRRKG